jgi:hypothetical protein
VSTAWTRHPELRDDYFGHYKRVMWLATLPLEIREAGDAGLERALENCVAIS